ncbi:MAG: hypothetical protein GX087_03925 [Desulfobulbaceae bacterium]|nr:hypothetical protein [Desulfobulbaceae bacterium]
MHVDLNELIAGIRAAMDYAVAEEKRFEAEELLDIYREDRLALTVLHEFYNFLPDATEDWVRDIVLLNRKQGIFLLALVTSARRYVYLASDEGIEFHGEAGEGYIATELLDFFAYENTEDFIRRATAANLASYEPLRLDADICPVCHAITGECHELGCVVEVCPWCGGQLVHCSCRHDQLGVDSITTEAQLLQFEVLLEERGRIPYAPEQRPAYLQEGWEEELE